MVNIGKGLPCKGFSSINFINTTSDTHKIIYIYVTYVEGIFNKKKNSHNVHHVKD